MVFFLTCLIKKDTHQLRICLKFLNAASRFLVKKDCFFNFSTIDLVKCVLFTCFKFRNPKNQITGVFLNTMKLNVLKKAGLIAALLLAIPNLGDAQTAVRRAREKSLKTSGAVNSVISERNVRAEIEFLASEAMQGRGSGTQFELLAGMYLASQLQQFGVEPAGEKDASGKVSYIQTINITRNAFTENPKITYTANGASKVLEYGKDLIALRVGAAQMNGGLQKITLNDKPRAGAIAFVKLQPGDDAQTVGQKLQAIAGQGAAAVILEETPQYRARWENTASRKLSFTVISGQQQTSSGIFIVSRDAANALLQVADGTNIEIKGQLAEPQKQQTWNAVGKLTGSDARLSSEAILLSAHMDHLGVRANAPGEDKIFNGADDDASGCVAVLELARVLAAGKRPKRTVYFAFFGSEEAGGFGSQFFVNTLPFPKENLVANLQFEMIGRPDAKVKPEELWLTGYERSDLGPELARRGAKLVQDPHPEQNFFQRSDNYTLARQGIVAHTVSSFGLHTDYHQASDELKTIDFTHMTRSINSMVAPIGWLVNSNFKPKWVAGKKP